MLLSRSLFYNCLLIFSIGASHSSQLAARPQHPAATPLEAARENFRRAQELLEHNEPGPADRYFLQAQQLYHSLPDWNMVVYCATMRSKINYELGRMDSLEAILDRAQAVVDREELKDENFKQERIFYFRGLYYEATAQYQTASDFLDQAVAILQAVKNPIALDSAFMSSHRTLAGSIYYDRRDFDTAIRHYHTALSLFPQSRPDQKKLLSIYNNIGLAYIDQGKVKEGLDYLSKSLEMLPDLDTETHYDHYLQTYFNLARAKLLLGSPPEAVNYLNAAKPLLEYKPADRHIWYSLLAQVYEQTEQWEAALENTEAALEARKQVRGLHHPSIARLYHSLGRIALQLTRREDALKAFQQALQVLDKNFDVSDPFHTPSLEGTNDLYLLIQLLKDKGDLLKSMQPDAAARILPTYRKAIEAIDSLRLLYESDASKLLLSREAKAVFAAPVGLLHQLYRQDARPEYLEEAFQYMEKSKALLLLENIRKWRNIRIRHRGASNKIRFNALLEKEKNAKLDLLLIQRTLDDYRESKAAGSAQKVTQLEEALRLANTAYEKVKTQLSDSIPQYYAASYSSKVSTIEHIQKKILRRQNTALISYLIFGDQSFGMLIRRDSVFLEPLAGPDVWQSDFDSYQSALRKPGSEALQSGNYFAYAGAAHHLYEQLLAPFDKHLTRSCSRLYIVPDDILGFLAFESLLASPAPAAGVDYSPAVMDYVVEHFALAYAYSATLLAESLSPLPAGSQNRIDYGGFAPVFRNSTGARAVSRDCSTGNLMYLPYSAESVQEAGALFQGDAFLNESATLANFRKYADQYKILQLSTHACVDEQDALFNVIYFHDTTLATYEIFDIPIRADLVILSACETGNGDLQLGEGVMSLSRGFYYAGSSNIVTSLWPADDHATKDLMLRLNRYLKKGLPKDQALQQAKLDYLQDPALRRLSMAPSFWANFILIGNQESIDLGSGHWIQWTAIVFFLLLISFLVYRFSPAARIS